MRRLAESRFEFSSEVRGTPMHDCTEIPEVNGAMQVAVNVSSHAGDLPSHQTASWAAIGARTTLDLSLQDARCRDQ